MKRWYSISHKEVVENLNSDLDLGLTYDKVERHREAYGKNIIYTPKENSTLKLFFLELFQPWVVVMIIFLIIISYLNLNVLLCISAILITFLLMSFFLLKINNEKKLKALEVLNSSSVKVLREGREEAVKSEDLVVGDVVFLEGNTYIPADIRLIDVKNLKVNELPITGIDCIIEKFSAKLDEADLSMDKMSNMVFKSSIIKEGEAIGIVTSVGKETQIGTMMETLMHNEGDKNLFINDIKSILNNFSLAGVALSCLCGVFSYFLNVESYKTLNIIGTLIYILMPIQSIILLLITIFIYVKKKKDIGVYIKNISSLKQISKIETLFLDKAGILTKDEAVVSKIFIDEKLLNAKSKDTLEVQRFYDPNKVLNSKEVTVMNSLTLERLINISLLCNDAKYEKEKEVEEGDIKELALIKFGLNNFVYKTELHNKYPRVFQVPIEGNRGIKTTLNKIDENYRANVVGSLDTIIENSTYVLKNGIEMELKDEEIEKIKEGAVDMALDGLDLVAFAYRSFNYEPSIDENIESNLVFVGVIGFVNPIKLETYEFKERCNELNLNPIIFTEDNKLTAKVFGKEIGVIGETNEIYSGIEFDYMSSRELQNIISNESLFSKLKEEDKKQIVKNYKDKGKFTGVVGSKLIELPHMSYGDISVSMGEKCSSIIKKLSDLFICDMSINKFFNTIYESRELLKFYKSLIYEFFLCASSLVFCVLISLSVSKDNILKLEQIWHLNLVLISMNGIALLMEYRESIFFREESYISYATEKNNISLSYLLIKGFSITLVSFILYSYALKSYSNVPHNLLLLFSLGVGLAFSPLNIIKYGLIFKKLLSNIAMFLNLVFVFFIVNFEGISIGFNFANFIKEHYIFIITTVILNYLVNVTFKDKNVIIDYMYMDYY